MAKKRHIKKLLNTLKVCRVNGNITPIVDKYFRRVENGRFSINYYGFMQYLKELEKDGYLYLFPVHDDYTPRLTLKSEKLFRKCNIKIN